MGFSGGLLFGALQQKLLPQVEREGNKAGEMQDREVDAVRVNLFVEGAVPVTCPAANGLAAKHAPVGPLPRSYDRWQGVELLDGHW